MTDSFRVMRTGVSGACSISKSSIADDKSVKAARAVAPNAPVANLDTAAAPRVERMGDEGSSANLGASLGQLSSARRALGPTFVPSAHPSIEAAISERFSYIEKIYHDIHMHPELSGQEVRTATIVADEMRQLGFDVTENVGGHGVVSVLKNGEGPTVMLRADMDALPIQEETGLPYASQVPGVMHACGHDVHTVVALATAYALAKNKNLWRGTLVMIAQPAEEIGAGAAAMIKDGLFERFPKPNFILAFHTSGQRLAGTIGIASGLTYSANDSYNITFKGRGAHASTPQLAIDPIAMLAEFLQATNKIVAREVDPRAAVVTTNGHIQAGTKRNIIPDTASVEGTLRTQTEEEREKYKRRIAEEANAIAQGAGAPQPPEITFLEPLAPVINDPKLVEQIVPALEGAVGKDQVQRAMASTSSEDFGAYGPASGAPEVVFWVGVQHDLTPPVYGNHTSCFAPEFPPTYTAAARGLAQSVLTLLPS